MLATIKSADLLNAENEARDLSSRHSALLKDLGMVEAKLNRGVLRTEDRDALAVRQAPLKKEIRKVQTRQIEVQRILETHRPNYAAAVRSELLPSRCASAQRIIAAVDELIAAASNLEAAAISIEKAGGRVIRFPLPLVRDSTAAFLMLSRQIIAESQKG